MENQIFALQNISLYASYKLGKLLGLWEGGMLLLLPQAQANEISKIHKKAPLFVRRKQNDS